MNAKKAKALRKQVSDWRDAIYSNARTVKLKPYCDRAEYKRLKKAA